MRRSPPALGFPFALHPSSNRITQHPSFPPLPPVQVGRRRAITITVFKAITADSYPLRWATSSGRFRPTSSVPHPSSPPLDSVGPRRRPSATAHRPGMPPHTASKAAPTLHRCRAVQVSAALPHLARCPLRTPPSLPLLKTAHLGHWRDCAGRVARGRDDHTGHARRAAPSNPAGLCWPVGRGSNAAHYCVPKKFFSELILILGIWINLKNP
jgi:hypothetical protein